VRHHRDESMSGRQAGRDSLRRDAGGVARVTMKPRARVFMVVQYELRSSWQRNGVMSERSTGSEQ
jgi:hypothetical protein